MNNTPNQPLLDPHSLKKDAEKCVQCGLCLPVCPTYNWAQQEAESPRGRIGLMKSLLDGTWDPPPPSLFQHLDQCLHCGACEKACPADVPYLSLIEGVMAAYPNPLASKNRPFWLRLFRRILFFPRLYRWFTFLFFAGQPLGRFFPDWPQQPWPAHLPNRTPFMHARSASKNRGDLILLTGCALSFFHSHWLESARIVFSQLGFNVWIPPHQGCCGALYAQHGEPTAAQSQEAHLIQVLENWFKKAPRAPLISLSTGCFSAYRRVFGDQYRILDWTDVIEPHWLTGRFSSSQTAQTWLLHQPCTQPSTQKRKIAQIFEQMPQCELLHLPADCCGSAGDYAAKYPEPAKKWAQNHLQILSDTEAQTAHPVSGLLTTNTGCALHLERHLRQIPQNHWQIKHPLQLLLKFML